MQRLPEKIAPAFEPGLLQNLGCGPSLSTENGVYPGLGGRDSPGGYYMKQLWRFLPETSGAVLQRREEPPSPFAPSSSHGKTKRVAQGTSFTPAKSKILRYDFVAVPVAIVESSYGMPGQPAWNGA
jgi:hypothetical protein